MIRRLQTRCLLRPRDIKPSHDDLEVVGVFNPGAVIFGDEIVLMLRVAERPRQRKQGYTGLPRRERDGNVVIDWIRDDELEPVDVRVVKLLRDDVVRLTFTSHIRIARSCDGFTVDTIDEPYFLPEAEYEEYGVEDPRITPIGDRFYVTYVAVSRHGAATALASTKDFRTFHRHGVIFYPENKDVVLFPEMVEDCYWALHRPNAATPFCKPEMWLARSPDLVHWGHHEHLLSGVAGWEVGRIGAGTPPIKTDQGWLEIYHGNRPGTGRGEIGIYSAGALLLDLENPKRILRVTKEPIMLPEADFERRGFVPNVVFPTGVVQCDDSLLVYYGAADTSLGVVEFSLSAMLGAMTPV